MKSNKKLNDHWKTLFVITVLISILPLSSGCGEYSGSKPPGFSSNTNSQDGEQTPSAVSELANDEAGANAANYDSIGDDSNINQNSTAFSQAAEHTIDANNNNNQAESNIGSASGAVTNANIQVVSQEHSGNNNVSDNTNFNDVNTGTAPVNTAGAVDFSTPAPSGNQDNNNNNSSGTVNFSRPAPSGNQDSNSSEPVNFSRPSAMQDAVTGNQN